VYSRIDLTGRKKIATLVRCSVNFAEHSLNLSSTLGSRAGSGKSWVTIAAPVFLTATIQAHLTSVPIAKVCGSGDEPLCLVKT